MKNIEFGIRGTRISRHGYLIPKKDLSEKILNEIHKDLRVTSENYYGNNKTFDLFYETQKYISVPKFYGIEKFGEIKDNTEYKTYNIKYTTQLNELQINITRKLLKGLKTQGGGLLVSYCGSGKTNIALYIACKLKLKTLFVVHKDFLKNQLIERIKQNTNVKKIGLIQGKVRNEKPVFVIGMLQTLIKLNQEVVLDKLENYGLIIIDEIHHMGAEKYSNFFKHNNTKYTFGITAENSRNDKLFKVITLYFGPILHEEPEPKIKRAIVKSYNFQSTNKNRLKIIYDFRGEINRSKMISNLMYIKSRNEFIIELIKKYNNRNILCLSGRILHVQLLGLMLDKLNISYGFYIGKMKEKELKKSSKKKVIIGTYDMAQEGLDIPKLDTLIFCTPKSSIKQAVGRILRRQDNSPLIIDIIDDNLVFKKQYQTRKRYYNKRSFKIIEN